MRSMVSFPMGCASLTLMTMALSPAWSQGTLLGSFGNTELQQVTGDSVQVTCAGLLQAGITDTPLFSTCNAMVETARDLDGEMGESVDRSLGLTQGELAGALQQIATEEFAATESMATEFAGNNMTAVLTRLIEVRRGVRGFSVAGLQPPDAETVAFDDWDRMRVTGARGGGAGDEVDWGRLGLFLNGSYSTGDRDETRRANEFDFDSYQLVAGADYRLTDNVVLGGAVTYLDVEADFDEKATVDGGDVNADGWGGFLYGTYYWDRFYVDALAGYARSDYDVRRKVLIPSNNANVATITETAKASPNSDDVTFSAGVGYDIRRGALTVGPYTRLTYLRVDVDGYHENGAEGSGLNLEVDGQDWTSLTSVLGAQFSYASSRQFGVLVPQGRIGWVHEFKNSSKTIEAQYRDDPNQNRLLARTDKPDRDYFELGLGISAVFRGGLQAFFNYDTILGFSNLSEHIFTLGARMEL